MSSHFLIKLSFTLIRDPADLRFDATHIKLRDLYSSQFPSSWSDALQEGGHWEQWEEDSSGD